MTNIDPLVGVKRAGNITSGFVGMSDTFYLLKFSIYNVEISRRVDLVRHKETKLACYILL